MDGLDFESLGIGGDHHFSSLSYWCAEVEALDVPGGRYLTVRITNLGQEDLHLRISRNSNVIWPLQHDPGYPNPEIPSAALLTTGLACAAGYVGIRRIRQRKEPPLKNREEHGF